MGVVFDFDGTLADTVDLLFDTARVVLRSAGFEEAASADFEALRNMRPRQQLEAVDIPMRAVPGLARRMRREVKRQALEVELADTVCDLIHGLDQSGFTVGIMSSNSPSLIRSVLDRAGVAHRIAFVARGGVIRDRARRLRSVVRRHSDQSGRWVFVGDEIRDVEAARRSGIPFVGVGWGVARPDALKEAGARQVAKSWSELRELLEAIRSFDLDPGWP